MPAGGGGGEGVTTSHGREKVKLFSLFFVFLAIRGGGGIGRRGGPRTGRADVGRRRRIQREGGELNKTLLLVCRKSTAHNGDLLVPTNFSVEWQR